MPSAKRPKRPGSRCVSSLLGKHLAPLARLACWLRLSLDGGKPHRNEQHRPTGINPVETNTASREIKTLVWGHSILPPNSDQRELNHHWTATSCPHDLFDSKVLCLYWFFGVWGWPRNKKEFKNYNFFNRHLPRIKTVALPMIEDRTLSFPVSVEVLVERQTVSCTLDKRRVSLGASIVCDNDFHIPGKQYGHHRLSLASIAAVLS